MGLSVSAALGGVGSDRKLGSVPVSSVLDRGVVHWNPFAYVARFQYRFQSGRAAHRSPPFVAQRSRSVPASSGLDRGAQSASLGGSNRV